MTFPIIIIYFDNFAFFFFFHNYRDMLICTLSLSLLKLEHLIYINAINKSHCVHKLAQLAMIYFAL